MESYVIGLGALVLLAVAWLGVQLAWRRTFPASGSDPDALAGRIGCHGCDDGEACEHRQAGDGDCTVGEEKRR